MRKVVVYTLLSVDGVAESPSDFVHDFDEMMLANLRRVIETQDAVLLGRTMYDEWSSDWPDSDFEPFASFINSVPKYVVTSSDLDLSWSNSTVLDAPLAASIADLRRRPGGDIGVHGSLTLAQSLLRTGDVDELRLVISPTIAGVGRRLFEDGPSNRPLELVRAERTPSGTLLADYRVGE
ncbi:dihydrofolate reductase family protein [Solicola gregarius]|uniref:Dihydrofolate reductase family protein n=1 Tax=Solicola gregarius TaxID=2908642 RepID=A0AA46TEL5_9ACTN|nr:dihydrofolate reductase family protein [Solicola gregarius]UYM03916.1 dihydrofolate reductase family protein [Solicola gregarius]